MGGTVTYSISEVRSSLSKVILLCVLIGLNLRPSMAAIGPLVERMQSDIVISYLQIAWLTSLPVMAMGFGCFVAQRVARAVGMGRLLGASLILIAMSEGARLFSQGFISLLITALVAGIGIAFIQALMPALIKRQAHHRAALVMGCYVSAIMAGAALSSVLSPQLANIAGSWRHGLAFWGLLALLTFAAWSLRGQLFSSPSGAERMSTARTSLYGQGRVWTLALFFGLGTAGYTCVLAWLPPYFVGMGWSESNAGLLLGYLTAVEVVAGLALPALAQRYSDRRGVVFIALLLAFSGFMLLWQMPLVFPHLTAGLLGAGIGGLFPLSLIIAMDHHEEPERAGAIAGIVQGVGYFIAALSPLAAGLLRDNLGSFELAWAVLAAVVVMQMLICLRFNPANYRRWIRD